MKCLIGTILFLALASCSSDEAIVCSTGNCGAENSPVVTPNNNNNPPIDNNNQSQNNLLVSGLTTQHRSGQTFLVWNEPNDSTRYHVYRSNQPISTANLSSATQLTGKWGTLSADTSVNNHRSADAPAYFLIDDLGAPLGHNQGLFVHTTKNGQSGNTYYAVTTVAGGSENRTISNGSNTTSSPVYESVATPRPVLTLSRNGGKGRLYTQYMDYASWNPTFNGYAFNYAVALPDNYNPSRSYPMQVDLHAYGTAPKFPSQSEYNWQVIQLFPRDPGIDEQTVHTWWYGHAADHNYQNSGNIPTSGRIENFTEQRVMRAIDEIISNPDFNVNQELIHAYGNSMGASGSISMAMRYPSVFAGVYASQPMTNYKTSPLFQGEFSRVWGLQSRNLPIVNRGPHAGSISRYSSNGSQPTNVWNWMNHQEQLGRRRSDDFAYMMMDFGKADSTIDWATQGRPMFQALTDARAAFAATAQAGIGHNWLGFRAVNSSQFGLKNDIPWRYPKSLSVVSLQYATGSGSLQPGTGNTDEYNTNLEWSTPHHSFHQNIVDTSNRYEISIRSLASRQTVSVTPRNTRAFNPASGKQCTWVARSNSDNSQTNSGSTTVDGNGLVTATAVPIQTGNGTRLVINCP